MVKKERKNEIPTPLPLLRRLLNFPDFSNPSDYYFSIFFPTLPTIPHPPSIRDLRVKDGPLHMYFSRILATQQEHLLEGTPLDGCFKRDVMKSAVKIYDFDT